MFLFVPTSLNRSTGWFRFVPFRSVRFGSIPLLANLELIHPLICGLKSIDSQSAHLKPRKRHLNRHQFDGVSLRQRPDFTDEQRKSFQFFSLSRWGQIKPKLPPPPLILATLISNHLTRSERVEWLAGCCCRIIECLFEEDKLASRF